jgi:hypothetical protein
MREASGIIENVLTQRYGPPAVSESDGELRWNANEEQLKCILFWSLSWDTQLRNRFGILKELYGDVRGGSLLGGSLKISQLKGPAIWSLYCIEQLQSQPEVLRAHELDPEICFFMDSANVWFYGVKAGELIVYDAVGDDLGYLGPAEPALTSLLIEFEEAKRE